MLCLSGGRKGELLRSFTELWTGYSDSVTLCLAEVWSFFTFFYSFNRIESRHLRFPKLLVLFYWPRRLPGSSPPPSPQGTPSLFLPERDDSSSSIRSLRRTVTLSERSLYDLDLSNSILVWRSWEGYETYRRLAAAYHPAALETQTRPSCSWSEILCPLWKIWRLGCSWRCHGSCVEDSEDTVVMEQVWEVTVDWVMEGMDCTRSSGEWFVVVVSLW